MLNRPLRSLGLPPFVTAIVLAVMLVWNLTANARPAASPEYLHAVRTQIAEIPYAIGPLVGTDLEVIPAAARMLRPNAMFQRVYRDPIKGYSISVVVVHCEDVRDLAGHYPPVCYPNAGWDQISDPLPIVCRIDGADIPARRYEFQRHLGLERDSLMVQSFFVLPSADTPYAPDMKVVDRAARSPQSAGLGAAHVMMVMPRSQDRAVSDRLVDDVLRALRPTIRAIAQREAGESKERGK